MVFTAFSASARSGTVAVSLKLQRTGGRRAALDGEAADAATIDGADQQGRTRGREHPATSQLPPTQYSTCHLSSISTNRNSNSLALTTLWATPARRA